MKEKEYIKQNDSAKLLMELQAVYSDAECFGYDDGNKCLVFFPESQWSGS